MYVEATEWKLCTFRGLHQPVQCCSHYVAHERVFTSWAGRELVRLQQRRLPLWLLKKNVCACQNRTFLHTWKRGPVCLPEGSEAQSGLKGRKIPPRTPISHCPAQLSSLTKTVVHCCTAGFPSNFPLTPFASVWKLEG